MPRQTRFCEQWLEQTDANGHLLKWWCKPDKNNIYAGRCILCFKSVGCSNQGLSQILQHASCRKHTDIAVVRFSKITPHLTSTEGTSSVIPADGVTVISMTNSVQLPAKYCVAKSRQDEVILSIILS